LLASATAANFGDLRLRSSSSQGDAFPLLSSTFRISRSEG
ncbi:MAG: hypothetical protein QOH05_3430, partial [Acetobacteraceae bacterium]|nr:hypothetical protein [Acetobacteraceae bacterium]